MDQVDRARHRRSGSDDAPTVRIPLPRPVPLDGVAGPARPAGVPSTPDRGRRTRRRMVLAAVAAGLVVVVGASAWWWNQFGAGPTEPSRVAGASLPAATLPAVSPAPVLATPAPTGTAARPGCPAAGDLAAAYRVAGTSPGRAGATAVGPVRCAGGFAVVRMHSPGDSETVGTIFRIGPPVRFLEAGSGPICTDAAAALPGSTVVPRSAAAALGCVSSAGTGSASTAPVATPTLGLLWRPDVKGYGEVRPREVNNDGDGASYVEGIAWSSWGGARAVGTGTAYYVSPEATSMIDGTMERATVVASDLGVCGGHPAYQKLTWFFPQHGETATTNDGFDACTGP